MEARTYIETFLDYMDAFHYLEGLIFEHGTGWEIKDSSGIQFMNGAWRVGCSFEKKIDKMIVSMDGDHDEILSN